MQPALCIAPSPRGSDRRTLAPEKCWPPPVRCLWSSATIWIFHNGRQREPSVALLRRFVSHGTKGRGRDVARDSAHTTSQPEAHSGPQSPHLRRGHRVPGGRDPVRGHVSPPVISLLSPAAVPAETLPGRVLSALGGANSAGGEPRQPHPRPLEHAASPT